MNTSRVLPVLVSTAMAAGLPLAVRSAEPAARFRVVDVASSLGDESGAVAVNGHGQVTGWARAADGKTSAFLYREGKAAALPLPDGFVGAQGLGMNDRGAVVGSAVRKHRAVAEDTGRPVPGEVEIRHAVLWEDGTVRDLGTGEARDINNRGEVVGLNARWRDGKTREPITRDTAVHRFNALAISENGAIAGTVTLAGNSAGRPALLRTRQLDLIDESVGGPEGAVHDVNSKGVAVGISSVLDGEAFIWSNGQQTLLGTMNGEVRIGFGGHAGYHHSVALGINERSQVVGTGNVSDRGLRDLHAFLWERGTLTDLNRLVDAHSGWTLQEAHDLNDRGEICGVGLREGKRRAFLLVPNKG